MQSEEEASQAFQSALSEFPGYPETDNDYTRYSSDDFLAASQSGDATDPGIDGDLGVTKEAEADASVDQKKVTISSKYSGSKEANHAVNIQEENNETISIASDTDMSFCKCCKHRITREFTTQTDFTLQRKLELKSEPSLFKGKCKTLFYSVKRKLYRGKKSKQKNPSFDNEQCGHNLRHKKAVNSSDEKQRVPRKDHSYDDLVSMGLAKSNAGRKRPEVKFYKEAKPSSPSPDVSHKASIGNPPQKTKVHYTEVEHAKPPQTEYMNVDNYHDDVNDSDDGGDVDDSDDEVNVNPNALKDNAKKSRSIFRNYVRKGDDSNDETSTFGVDVWSDFETLTREDPPPTLPPVPPRCKPTRHQSFLNADCASRVKQNRSASLPTANLEIETAPKADDESHQYENLSFYRTNRTRSKKTPEISRSHPVSNVTISISHPKVSHPSIVLRRDSKILSKLRKLPFRRSSYLETETKVYNNTKPKSKSGIINTN